MKKPNFFILGAPKCGTTSLATWLSEHPQIYMSPKKEPHFFNNDENHIVTPTLELYEKLFLNVTATHKAIGEASVWYLHSDSAVPNIERYSPNARYVVCLRNPVEMVYSLHEQQIVNGNENVINFENAWRLNENRLKGKSVTRLCREPRHLSYGNACRLGDQLERLLSRIDSDRVLPLLLDDVKENPQREYHKILFFLGVEDDSRTDFSVHNTAKKRRSPFLQKMVMVAGRLKRRLGIYRSIGILSSIEQKNLRYRQRTPLSPYMRRALQAYFESDIKKLSGILNRDLSHWVQP